MPTPIHTHPPFNYLENALHYERLNFAKKQLLTRWSGFFIANSYGFFRVSVQFFPAFSSFCWFYLYTIDMVYCVTFSHDSFHLHTCVCVFAWLSHPFPNFKWYRTWFECQILPLEISCSETYSIIQNIFIVFFCCVMVVLGGTFWKFPLSLNSQIHKSCSSMRSSDS